MRSGLGFWFESGVNAMPRKGDSAAPVGMMTTEIQVPVFPLASRCSICRLFQTHREQFLEATQMLMLGEEQQAVEKWLNKHRGINVTIKSLSRHYHGHMLPYFSEALELERRFRAQMAAMDPDTPATIASALARSAAMQLLEVVGKLNPEQLAGKADAKLIDAISRAAETIAKIDAYGADRRIKETELQLKKIKLDRESGDLEAAGARWFLMQLQDHPEAANEIRAVLRRHGISLPAPAKQMKALPAPAESKPNASTKDSTTRRHRRRSSRTKR